MHTSMHHRAPPGVGPGHRGRPEVHYTMLYCTILCYAILYSILYYTILYNPYTMLYCTIPYFTIRGTSSSPGSRSSGGGPRGLPGGSESSFLRSGFLLEMPMRGLPFQTKSFEQYIITNSDTLSAQAQQPNVYLEPKWLRC